MAPIVNMLSPADLKSLSVKLTRAARRLGDADSAPVKAAAGALARGLRRVLRSSRGGAPSRPGQVPKLQTGALAKSVRQGVDSGGYRRVAVTRYTAPILEAGVDTSLPPRSGKARRRKAGQARRKLRIAARPFFRRGIDLAMPEMVDVFVSGTADQLEDDLGR
ncbi:MAG: hypothetical protein AB7R55_13035 [Gemmatimonadales bacterium]